MGKAKQAVDLAQPTVCDEHPQASLGGFSERKYERARHCGEFRTRLLVYIASQHRGRSQRRGGTVLAELLTQSCR
jgi:hypothetical protein